VAELNARIDRRDEGAATQKCSATRYFDERADLQGRLFSVEDERDRKVNRDGRP
jgi:hypothetical protein